MNEQCIIGARASVMVYDDTQKKWVPSGTSSGLSKVQIFHHQQNNTFRVVGRKLQDHEVVINCSIVKGLKYNQATSTFHQWRDFKYVYGLNFSSSQDAEAFARAMMHALEVLSGRAMVQPTGIMQPTNGNSNEEDMGYRTMTREDAAMLQQPLNNGSPQTPTSQQNQNNIPQSPPTPQGHHRTSRNSLSAPPAPQPPQMSMPPQQQPQPIYNQGGMLQQQMHNGGGMPPLPPQGPQQTNPYHAPQQLHQQQQQQQQHPVYSSQPLNSNYQQNQSPQNMAGGGVAMVPQPPQPPVMHQNGPIYVSSQQTQQQLQQQQQQQQPPQGPGIPNSASSNSVIYASQQIKQEPTGPQPLQQPQSNNNYGQTNGHHQIDGVYGQIPVAPPINGMPPLNNGTGNNVPAPPPMMSNRGGAPVPPAPPAPPMMGGGGAPPPPPPPPMMGGGPPAPPAPPIKKEPDAQQDFMGSLAAQLQQAKLKKKNATPQANENSGSSTSSGNSAGNYGTIGRSSKGMVSMMDEMAKTLARRRAQVDKKDQPAGEIVSDDVKQRPWEKSNTLPHKLGSNSSGSNSASNNANGSGSGSESPRPMRKRFGSASEETILKQVNGDGLSIALSDLDSLKAEIVREMRLEIQKAKQEIIEAIKTEFNRR